MGWNIEGGKFTTQRHKPSIVMLDPLFLCFCYYLSHLGTKHKRGRNEE
jgi:hypothetical protein